MNWTEQQQQAITCRSRRTLVSAAAGSGKTAVLVERVFRRLTDEKDPCDISRFLIVTFTNAAAAEMRSRILKRLTEALAADPQNRHLRRQMNLVHTAQIMTVHAFCLSLIRENFHTLHLRPDFRLPDDDETLLLLDEAAEQLMEEAHAQHSPDFSALLDIVSNTADKGDGRLCELIKKAYIWLESEADSEAYIAARRSDSADSNLVNLGATPWGRMHLSVIAQQAESLAAGYERGIADLLLLDVNDKVTRAIETAEIEQRLMENIRLTASEGNWSACRRNFEMFDAIDRKPTIRASKDLPAEALAFLAGVRDEAYDWRKKMRGDVLRESTEMTAAAFHNAAPLQQEFFRLVVRLGELFTALKTDANVLDFADLEHLAVRLLAEKDASGAFQPTQLALEKSQALVEIMVDEYQDTNGLQDLIFRMLAADCSLFMVGDVKQSIYRFRRADPTIFLRRRDAYANAADPDRQAIVLSDNFRSRPEVLSSANLVFEHLMSQALGEMAYSEAERLRCGRGDEPNALYRTELHILNLAGEDDGGDEDGILLSATEREAVYVASAIRSMIDEGFPVAGKDGDTRPCRCGDFAILLRNMKNRASIYCRALQAHGLATDADKREAFFETSEITALVALLRAVDNPVGGLDLPACMASPLFGFSFDDLAQIRAANERAGCFLDSLIACADGETALSARAAGFLRRFDAMRLTVASRSAGDAVAYLIEETSAAAVFSAMAGGSSRSANIRLLLGMAQRYERLGGFGDFVRYLRRLEERGAAPRQPASADSDSVRLMSVHGSKGLEFPIVLLAGLSESIRFDRSDAAVLHPTLGLGLPARDWLTSVEQTTLQREAIYDALLSEQLSEELRILYVAMTRAREKLILITRHNDMEKALRPLEAGLPPVPAAYCRNHRSFAAWVEAVAIPAGEGVFAIHRVAAPPAVVPAAPRPEMPAPDEALCAEIREQLAFVYPHAAAASLPAKLTATIYKRLCADDTETAALRTPPAADAPKTHTVPRFLSERTALSAAERGTATHLAMQLLPVRAYQSEAEIDAGIETLRKNNQMTPAQASAIRRRDLLRFYQSPLGREIAALPPERVHREFKFSILTDAARYFPANGAGESMLLQGVIDLYTELDDGSLAILDFKTDAVTKATSPARAAAYAPQLAIYADALTEMTGRNIAARRVYFFATGEVIDV